MRNMRALLIVVGLMLAAAAPVAAAGALCHTAAAAQACECCAHPQPASDCQMGCTDAHDARPADASLVTSPRGEQTAAVLQPSTSLYASTADAAASRPMRIARAPDTSSEALYLLDRALRL